MSQLRIELILAFDVVATFLLVAAAVRLREDRKFMSLFAAALASMTAGRLLQGLHVTIASKWLGLSDDLIRPFDWLLLATRLAVAGFSAAAFRAAGSAAERFLAFGLVASIVTPLFSELHQVVTLNFLSLPEWAAALAYVVAVAAFLAAVVRRETAEVGLLAAGLALIAIPDGWRAVDLLGSQTQAFLPPGLTVPCFLGALACFGFAAAHAENRLGRLIPAALAVFVVVGVWNNVALATDCGFGVPKVSCLMEHVNTAPRVDVP